MGGGGVAAESHVRDFANRIEKKNLSAAQDAWAF